MIVKLDTPEEIKLNEITKDLLAYAFIIRDHRNELTAEQNHWLKQVMRDVERLVLLFKPTQ